MAPTRRQIYVSRRSREVWQEAEAAAKADDVSVSDFVASALHEYLAARKRRIARSRRPA